MWSCTYISKMLIDIRFERIIHYFSSKISLSSPYKIYNYSFFKSLIRTNDLLIFLFLFSLFKIFLSRYNNYFDYYIIGQISSFQFAFQFFLRQIFMKLDYEKSDEHSKLLIKSMKRFDPRSIAIRFLLFFWKSCRKI